MGAGVVAMYFLGYAFWLNQSDQATVSGPGGAASKANTGQPELRETDSAT